LACATAAAVYGSTPHSTVTINACANLKGVLRLIPPGAPCGAGETPISWNMVGPMGPPGLPGLQGTQGPPGDRGASGEPVLKLVDAAGVDVAPVIDTSEGTRRFVRVSFKVEGRPALAEAYTDFFRSNDIPAIYYETANCTGRAFIRNAFGDPLVAPLAAVTGVAGDSCCTSRMGVRSVR
jgi:hypothetical protein